MRIAFAFFLTLPLISMAGEPVSKSYQMPIKNEQGIELANIGIQLHMQKTEACLTNLAVEAKQLNGRQTPMAYVIAQVKVSDVKTAETGAKFGLSINLAWHFKTTPGQKQIGTTSKECRVSCAGDLTCK